MPDKNIGNDMILRVIFVLLVSIYFMISAYTINCMVYGQCHNMAWISVAIMLIISLKLLLHFRNRDNLQQTQNALKKYLWTEDIEDAKIEDTKDINDNDKDVIKDINNNNNDV
jgi:hypothetical protein